MSSFSLTIRDADTGESTEYSTIARFVVAGGDLDAALADARAAPGDDNDAFMVNYVRHVYGERSPYATIAKHILSAEFPKPDFDVPISTASREERAKMEHFNNAQGALVQACDLVYGGDYAGAVHCYNRGVRWGSTAFEGDHELRPITGIQSEPFEHPVISFFALDAADLHELKLRAYRAEAREVELSAQVPPPPLSFDQVVTDLYESVLEDCDESADEALEGVRVEEHVRGSDWTFSGHQSTLLVEAMSESVREEAYAEVRGNHTTLPWKNLSDLYGELAATALTSAVNDRLYALQERQGEDYDRLGR